MMELYESQQRNTARLLEIDNILTAAPCSTTHISHELRTPVSVIGPAIDALAAGAPSETLLPEMRAASTRFRRVVDQLVESARARNGATSSTC
jgi:K+-sensing histidine kinase KdpD